MTFLTDSHPKKLPPLHAYPQHVERVMTKPTKSALVRERIRAILAKIGVDKRPKAP